MAVTQKLARIDAAVSLVLVENKVQSQAILRSHGYSAEKLEEDAKFAEEFINNRSETACLKMFRYIYTEAPVPEPRHDRRRRWWGWEI